MPKYLVKFNQAFCDALSQHASLCDKTGTPFVSPEQYVYVNDETKAGEKSRFAIHHFHPNAKKSKTAYRPKEAFASIAEGYKDLKPFIESELTAEGLPSMSFGKDTLFWSDFLNIFTKKMSEKTTESHELLISQSIQQAIEDSFDKENVSRIVPITPLRIAYAEKHKDEMSSERLIQDFRESLLQYEKYKNENDLFLVSTNGNSKNKSKIETHLSTANNTSPDKAAIYLKRTLHLAYRAPSSVGKKVNQCTVALQKYIIDVKNTTKGLLEKPKLFYVDAEVDFRRTRSGLFADGSSAKSSATGGVDLLLYNPTTQRPVIGEYKSKSDSTLDYAFIQALTYASELLPPHQMERFYRSYISQTSGDYLPLPKDFAHAPSRTSPEVELLLIYDRGAQKQEKTIPTVQKWIKEILAADVGIKAVTIATYDKDKPATDARLEQTHFFSKDEVSAEHKPLSICPPALQSIA